MTIVYRGESGTVYQLDKRLGGGGEGDVYAVLANEKIVAKIFNLDVDALAEKQEKLRVMTKIKSSMLDHTAWPKDLLLDSQGRIVGYTMLRIPSMIDFNEIYDPGSEVQLGWQSRVALAYNLCARVNEIHMVGQVIGDFNPNNICVSPENWEIYLIDADSFHITDNGRTYRCGVGMAPYLPKSLQLRLKMKLSLNTMSLPTFTKQTDYFALAVHVFQLLMNGCHPFALRIIEPSSSVRNPLVMESIIDAKCAFINKYKDYDIPLFAPKMDILPTDLQVLFRRAFQGSYVRGDTDLPTPAEWRDVLEPLYKQGIKECPKKHKYYVKLDSCPWCIIDDRMARMASPPPPPVRPVPPPPPLRPTPASPSPPKTSVPEIELYFNEGGKILLKKTCIRNGITYIDKPYNFWINEQTPRANELAAKLRGRGVAVEDKEEGGSGNGYRPAWLVIKAKNYRCVSFY